jgi:hypothetical protein
MVVLLDGPVVVEQGRLRARHDVETIGRSCVLKIVNDGSYDGGKDLQIGQPVLCNDGANTQIYMFSTYISLAFIIKMRHFLSTGRPFSSS